VDDDGESPGRLLIIGGAEDRCCGAGLLERFVGLCGGERARIVLVTTATGLPDQVRAEYEQVFRKLGVEQTRELRLRGRADADSDAAAAALRDSTGVFFSGGDQSRILALVGSRANDILRDAADEIKDHLHDQLRCHKDRRSHIVHHIPAGKSKRCFLCGLKGHIRLNCPNKGHFGRK